MRWRPRLLQASLKWSQFDRLRSQSNARGATRMEHAVDGYTIDTPYTYKYFPYLSPTWLHLACFALGVPFPERRPLRYLELGYGHGISLNIHAASCPGEYWGTDANQQHVEFTRALSAAAGSNIIALDVPFRDLPNHAALPFFLPAGPGNCVPPPSKNPIGCCTRPDNGQWAATVPQIV